MKIKAVHIDRCIGCYSCMFACARHNFRSISVTKCALHVKSHGGLEGGFTVITCRACEDPPCVKACKRKALVKREGGGCKLIEELCNGCGACVKSCIIGALMMDEESLKPITCRHCGICAKYCPHNVLQLVE